MAGLTGPPSAISEPARRRRTACCLCGRRGRHGDEPAEVPVAEGDVAVHPELAALERFYLEVRAAVSAGQIGGPEGIARVTGNTIRDANNFEWMVSAQTSTPDKASFVVIGADGTLFPAEPHQFQPAQQAPAISAGPSWEHAAAPTTGAYQPTVHEPAYQGPAAMQQHQPDIRPGQGFQHQPQPQFDESEAASKGLAGYVEQFKAFPLYMKAICGVVVMIGLFFVVTSFTGGGEDPVEDPTFVTSIPASDESDDSSDVVTTDAVVPAQTAPPVTAPPVTAAPAPTVAPVVPETVPADVAPVETIAPAGG